MIQRVQKEIREFTDLAHLIGKMDALECHSPISNGFVIKPKTISGSIASKPIGLTIMAITHGNEVAGLPVLNSFLRQIVSGQIELKIPVAVILGNPEAAESGLRYLERDLNRSFNHSGSESKESLRAKKISKILDETFLLIDIHQTKEPAESPFFIFPFSPSGFAFARQISTDIPIVTHWGKPFSQEGMCTDEYTNRQGGCGITLEIGQNSFHPFHIGVGYYGIMQALSVANDCWPQQQFPSDIGDTNRSDNIYTFSQIVDYPETGEVVLAPNFNNFTFVEPKQPIAKVLGVEIRSETAGPVLFPQYMRHGEKFRPSELIRVLRRAELSELPFRGAKSV